MQPGITYSASMWYTTEPFGYNNWKNLSILLNTSQDSTGSTVIQSTSGPAISSIYKSLSNTFQVPAAGIYYVGIQASSDGNCCGEYLSWDDLLIEIPCSLNTPTISLSASTNSVCAGDPVNLTANGTTSYSWNTGANGATIVETPLYDATYTVMGIDTISGCTTTQSQNIAVFPKPQLTTFATPPVICSGAQSYISASGAQTYAWSNLQNGQVITVNPTSTTSYTVIGYNQYNCSSEAVQEIVVNPLPNVTANADRSELCAGETIQLTGSGATTYQWMSQSSFVQGQQVIVSPNATTSFTLNGIDANGCSKITTIILNVSDCVGINEIVSTLGGVRVYPNPTEGMLTIEVNGETSKNVEVIDMTGRVVMSNTMKAQSVNVNLTNLANGIYYVKIQSETSSEVIKIVKQ